MFGLKKGPGIGIGRGRGVVKKADNNGLQNLANKENNDKKIVETIYSNCSNDEVDYEIRPPRVKFVPNDDLEDYKLHVDSGVNFDKFEAAKVNVTGEDVPQSISNISDLNIFSFLKVNLSSLGFKSLTPIQRYTIPIIDSGRDVMACAETGSGKTAAFLVPIINKVKMLADLSSSTQNSPHCIIIVPSRELCRQVFTAAVGLCKSSSIKCGYGYGGVEMCASLQKIVFCDILCVTPGRMMQYLNSGLIMLDRLRYFVLDEADKLLGCEHFLEVVKLVASTARVLNSRELQVSMFSATYPRAIQCLAQELLNNYLFVAVGIVGAANSDIVQTVLPVTASNKLGVTLEYIANHKLGKTLMFVKQKRLADFYGIRLIEMGLSTTTIHGDRDQSDREQALNDFKSGRVEVLVATDVASRGLDIPNVDTVLNVDMPDDMDVYVHRIGRSGRCGNPGAAVTFFDTEENYHQAPRLVQILRGSCQQCPNFLINLSQGVKARNTLKSSMKDLRSIIQRDNLAVVPTPGFMNMQNESDEDDN